MLFNKHKVDLAIERGDEFYRSAELIETSQTLAIKAILADPNNQILTVGRVADINSEDGFGGNLCFEYVNKFGTRFRTVLSNNGGWITFHEQIPQP